MNNRAIIRWMLIWGGVFGVNFTNSAQTPSQYQNSLSKLRVLRTLQMDSNLETKSDSLFVILTNEVFPAWYGTAWDFNGISNTPQKGEIACGYFVSTTLKHAGFNLNRYKLAQQASAIITTQVCGSSYTKGISSYSRLFQELGKYHTAVFIVGLDFHVGFIVVENNISFFVHSDYITGKVIREKAIDSESIKSSNAFVLGKLSDNKELIYKWENATKLY